MLYCQLEIVFVSYFLIFTADLLKELFGALGIKWGKKDYFQPLYSISLLRVLHQCLELNYS